MLRSMPEWIKTLAIALVSSFFAVILVEPVKAFIQRRMRRRELRRSLYHEMIRNYSELLGQVTLAHSNREMKSGIGERFATVFKKFSFELARREPTPITALAMRCTGSSFVMVTWSTSSMESLSMKISTFVPLIAHSTSFEPTSRTEGLAKV
jgi:hypothetical protein